VVENLDRDAERVGVLPEAHTQALLVLPDPLGAYDLRLLVALLSKIRGGWESEP